MTTLIAPCTPIEQCGSNCCYPSALASISIFPSVANGLTVNYTLRSAGIRAGSSKALFDNSGRCLDGESVEGVLQGQISVRLEYSRAGTANADDWTAATEWADDSGVLADTTQRNAGWYDRAYYRIAFRDVAENLAYSPIFSASMAGLTKPEQRMLRRVITDELRRYKSANSPARNGYLLKVRYYGEPCAECYDVESGKRFKSDCATCHGVGYILGYYPPVPCFAAEFLPISSDLKVEGELGMYVKNSPTMLRFLNIPEVHPWDIWVDAATDQRFIIGEISPLTSFGPYNVICRAAAGRLDFDHPAYKVRISGEP